MTIEQALAWADQTMNERLREARRTGNDHDYDAAMEGCIDILAAEVRRLRPYHTLVHDSWDEVCDDGCDSWGHAETCKCVNLTQAFIAAKADLTALRERHAEAVEAAWREGALMILDCPFTSEDLDRMWRQSEARRKVGEGR